MRLRSGAERVASAFASAGGASGAADALEELTGQGSPTT
jgi:hypothetical protein